MLPLTVSFETVLQIFNNNFKQEEVKVSFVFIHEERQVYSLTPEKAFVYLCACMPVCLKPTSLSHMLMS